MVIIRLMIALTVVMAMEAQLQKIMIIMIKMIRIMITGGI